MGVDAVYAGALGTGPWSDRIRAALEREGIAHGGVTDREDDNGLCIALTDAERTFVSVRGAETRLGPHGFRQCGGGGRRRRRPAGRRRLRGQFPGEP